MASEKQQAGRALRRLARRNPLVALAIAAVLVVGAALGWFGAAGGGGAEDVAPDRNGQAAVISAEDNLQQVQVVRVVDGDTLKVSVPGDENATVRLIGMDTPESLAADEARNCEEGRIASDYAKSLVAPGQTVWLSRDVSDADRYGRLLRYVWLERPDDPADEGGIAEKMLNAILVRDGYAQVKRYNPDTTLHDLFQRWGDEATADGRGVTHKWAEAGRTPSRTRRRRSSRPSTCTC